MLKHFIVNQWMQIPYGLTGSRSYRGFRKIVHINARYTAGDKDRFPMMAGSLEEGQGKVPCPSSHTSS
jgi:hypothetical protein